MVKVCIDLDEVDIRIAETHMYRLRETLHLPELEMEAYLLYAVKQWLYGFEPILDKNG